MQCDRAQEFFSDYLERTLDRPMTIALESHLAGCASCREGVEALQAVCFALDSVPEVEPPADGAWRVMMKLREERARVLEAERRKAPTFLDWLRSLNPMGVAMGAGLATLIIGGMLLVPNLGGMVGMDFGGIFRTGSTGSGTTVSVVSNAVMPSIDVSRGPSGDAGQQLDFRLTPSSDMPDGELRYSGNGIPLQVATKTMRRGAPLDFTVVAPPGSDAQVIHISTRSGARRLQYDQTVIVPLVPQNSSPVTLVQVEQPLEQVVQRLVPYVGRVVVIDGPANSPVTLQAGEQPVMRCLQDIAGKSHLTIREENGAFRLVPQP
jgi:hypothetical protein